MGTDVFFWLKVLIQKPIISLLKYVNDKTYSREWGNDGFYLTFSLQSHSKRMRAKKNHYARGMRAVCARPIKQVARHLAGNSKCFEITFCCYTQHTLTFVGPQGG